MRPSFSVTCITLIVLFSQPSVSAQSFRSCVKSAVGNDILRYAFPDIKPLYDLLYVKPYNLYYDITPAAVTYPKSAQEVSKLVKCAASNNIKVQARSGGHSFGDYCIGGTSGTLVLDLQHLNQRTYNPTDQTAHLGPGNHLEDVNKFLFSYNRLVPHGDAPQVGVGGHYTIGGLGRVSRMLGAAVDQILDATVVLANGDVVTCSATINQDLFFAIRGAGASFGVVTDFHVATKPAISTVIAYTYNVTLGDAKLQASAFKAWQKLISSPNLPWKMSSQFLIFPFGSVITGFFFGSPSDFSALSIDSQIPGLDPDALDVRVINGAIAIGQEISELGLQLFGGVSTHFYSKSLAFTNTTLLTDDTIDAMFGYLTKSAASINTLKVPWFIIFDLEAGAINAPSQSSAAYPFRDALYFLQSYTVDVLGIFQKDARKFLDGLNGVIQSRQPQIQGSYAGYVDPFLPNAQQQYWGANYPRLQSIKARLDPGNVFANPQSVVGKT